MRRRPTQLIRWGRKGVSLGLIVGATVAVLSFGLTGASADPLPITYTIGSQLTATTAVIKIDADPPTGLAASASRAPDFSGWYNHPVGMSWRGSDATSGIAACSTVTYSGPDRAGAAMRGGCTDRAGNSASAPVSINYDATAPVLSKLWVRSGPGS